jgi:pulcherriminic acid synthase
MREDAPLVWHEAMHSYIISRYDDVERAFRNPVFTAENYPWQVESVMGRTISRMTGREHAVQRAMVAPEFRGRQLRDRVLPVIERNARGLIDRFLGVGSADLVSEFCGMFPANMTADMLGLGSGDHEKFRGWSNSVVTFLGDLGQDPEVTAAAKRTRKEFAAHLAPIIRERRVAPREDLLSALCVAEVDGMTMSDEDIETFCCFLLFAGTRTSELAIASVFANLLTHPVQLAAVRVDRELIPQAFAETLRYSPPLHMVMRKATEDVIVSGGKIRAGSAVTCLIGAANRDPQRYADPDTFNIFREDLTVTSAFSAAADHLAFALGRHFCVGTHLAKAEVEIVVNQVLDAMPDMVLEDGFTPAEQGHFTRGPDAVRVRFTPHDS